MEHPHGRFIYSAVLAFVVTAMVGCGNGESSTNSEGKWFDAGNVQQAYRAQIRSDALSAGKEPLEADTSCKTILAMAQESLSDSSSTGTIVQLMYKTCNDIGLTFQSQARCEADRLQVMCR